MKELNTNDQKYLEASYDAIKDRRLKEDFAVVLPPSCDYIAIFASTAQNIINEYITSLRALGLTLSYCEQKTFYKDNRENETLYGTLLTVPKELQEKGIVILSITAAKAAIETGIKTDVEDFIFIGPKIIWEPEESWGLHADVIIPKESLKLCLEKSNRKYIPKDLIGLCRNWNSKSVGHALLLINNLNKPQISPKTKADDDSFNSFKEEYIENVSTIMGNLGEIIDPEWREEDYIRQRVKDRIDSPMVGKSLEKNVNNLVQVLDMIPVPPPESSKNTTFTINPQKKVVEIQYDMKMIEEMGVDDLFFHRLLR